MRAVRGERVEDGLGHALDLDAVELERTGELGQRRVSVAGVLLDEGARDGQAELHGLGHGSAALDVVGLGGAGTGGAAARTARGLALGAAGAALAARGGVAALGACLASLAATASLAAAPVCAGAAVATEALVSALGAAPAAALVVLSGTSAASLCHG